MQIRGQEIDVDYLEELEPYTFNRQRIRDNKLQACSPFREDSRPSFAVNLDTGTWIDSGAEYDHLKKGNFISLLALLRDTDYSEVEEYLLDKYGVINYEANSLSLKLNLDLKMEGNTFNKKLEYRYSRYLDKIRGIDPEIQKLFNVSEVNNAVAFGWYNIQGKLINIKYRSVLDKSFWYESDGTPIKDHIYGLNVFIKNRSEELWITEAEIDCMYLWSLGKKAVALGRGSVNDRQIDLIKKSGASTIVIATDNDAVGHQLRDVLIRELSPYFNIKKFNHPEGIKDVNELDNSTNLDKLTEKIQIFLK